MSTSETFHLNYEDETMFRKSGNKKALILCSLIAGIVGLGIGILIGYFGICDEEKGTGVFLEGVTEAIVQDGDPQITDKLFAEIQPHHIEKYLRQLADTPRVAGTTGDYKSAQILYQFWKENGADQVTMVPYDVLLSYVNETDPSRVYLMNHAGGTEYETAATELNLTHWDNKENLMSPILGYTAAGDATGEFVYANYARDEDFHVLREHDIRVKGKVVICRFGKGYRGDKVSLAESLGAIAVVIYSDPADWVESNSDTFYPDSRSLPPSGVQRGSAFDDQGDPITPGYPATEFAFRVNPDNITKPLPKIPAVPIGYGDAQVILSAMRGIPAPGNFTGSLNITYRLGQPGAHFSSLGLLRVKSTNYNEVRRIYNVFGIVRGSIEPDRYVIVGAHRDSWVYGAIDNAAGSAVMMETSRAMMKLVKEGVWRPKRTLIFSSSSGEEYALIGATEWIEEFYSNLQHRTVAYLNLDCAVIGNFSFRALGSPQLYRTIYDATKRVTNPNKEEYDNGLKTVYDSWLSHNPWKHHETEEDLQIPEVGKITQASDFGPYLIHAGIPAVDFRYYHEKNNLSFYSTYHSAYDTVDVLKYYDPDYKVHTTVAQVAAEFMRLLSDSSMIPFNVSDSAWQLQVSHDLLRNVYGDLMKNNSIEFDHLTSAVENFTRDAEEFQKRIAGINRNNPLTLRQVNDQLMLMERAFLDPIGVPGNPFSRHVISATSDRDAYGASGFPGLTDGMYEIDKTPEKWEEVKKHFAAVIHAIRSASSTLRDVVQFLPQRDT